jgi:putative transposase
MARRSRQLELPAPKSWGGKRTGAGRPPAPGRPRTGHDRRPTHNARHPVLVTLRAARGVPSLRSLSLFATVRNAIPGRPPDALRVIHFSVQQDHVHAIVEADSHAALTIGIRGLTIRIALAVKRVTGVKRVWGDRCHMRALTTPREVRHAIAYVLLNFRKHLRAPAGIDPCSSGPWFDHWARSVRPAAGRPPTAAARTWLASVGWRRGGPIHFDEGPVPPPRISR